MRSGIHQRGRSVCVTNLLANCAAYSPTKIIIEKLVEDGQSQPSIIK